MLSSTDAVAFLHPASRYLFSYPLLPQSNLMRDEALQDDIYQEYQGPYQDSYEIQEYQEEHDANNSADITGKIW